jgi:hypothetical protein
MPVVVVVVVVADKTYPLVELFIKQKIENN